MEPVQVIIHRALADASVLPPDARIVIGVHRRMFLKRKWEAEAPDGTRFSFDLESRLPDGGVIHHQSGRDYIVSQLPERVYEICFDSPARAAEIAWKTGNLHLPVEILSSRIRILHDPATLELLHSEGWQFSEPEVQFHPLKIPPHRSSAT